MKFSVQAYLHDRILRQNASISNQLVHFFATAKIQNKMTKIEDIEDLKLPPIIDQTGIYIHNASKVIANYQKPLA